ncbi:hypothetical protein [Leisingera caerulea]|uniref:hypothetical protein n=1 Tax=Leisingera caerulea TaxID=506591 RepID=UPI0004831075|nr:hypothetical protein [Leisingera caerulea]
MPTYSVTVRRQIAHTCLVEAENATEAKRIAREERDKCEWIGFEEIYDGSGPKPTVMACAKDSDD